MYTVFDFDPAIPGGRIGFAQLAAGGNPGTGPISVIQPGTGNPPSNNGTNNGNNNNNTNNNGGNKPPGNGASSLQSSSALQAFIAVAIGVVAASVF